jgi:hypothetical protein
VGSDRTGGSVGRGRCIGRRIGRGIGRRIGRGIGGGDICNCDVVGCPTVSPIPRARCHKGIPSTRPIGLIGIGGIFVYVYNRDIGRVYRRRPGSGDRRGCGLCKDTPDAISTPDRTSTWKRLSAGGDPYFCRFGCSRCGECGSK